MVGKSYSKVTAQSKETALSRGRAAMGGRMLEGSAYGFWPLLIGLSRRSLLPRGAAWSVQQTEQVKLLRVPLPTKHLILILCYT